MSLNNTICCVESIFVITAIPGMSMDENFWNELASVFADAIERPAEDRAQFLDAACEGNPLLREEVDSLIAYYDRAPDFLDDVSSLMDFKTKIRDRGGGEDHFNLVGTKVSKYEVVDMIGAGGMGMVYKAVDHELQRSIALKFLSPALSSEPEARERFMREARAASALDHPNVCTVYEVGRTESGQIFIAMAYYEGQTLKALLKDGPLDQDKVLYYAGQVARGLAKAHEKGIIHRDIKPANVMVTEDNQVKILDFGLAKMAGQNLTRQGATMGTVAYMSPEQIRGDTVDHSTDVWSLGVLIYELLEGRHPFKGDYEQAVMYSVLNDDPGELSHLSIQSTGVLKDIIGTCLQKEPECRYQSMVDILRDIEVLAGERSLSDGYRFNRTMQRGPLERASNAWRSAWVKAGAVGAVLLLAVLLFGPAVAQFGTENDEHIAVLPLQFQPQTQDNQAFASGLSYVLTNLLVDLTGSDESTWVVPASEMQRYEVQTPKEAADIFGADKVLSGDMYSTSDVISFTLRLINPINSGVIKSEQREARREEVDDALDQGFQDLLLDGLVNILGLSLEADTREAIKDKLPENDEAYRLYIQGIGYLFQYHELENLDRAIGFFEQSLAEDSLFAMAHAGLCQAYWEKSVRTTDASFLELAVAQCSRASALGESTPEVMTAVGMTYFETGQFDAAKRELQDALALDPENADAYRWLGRVYEQQNNPDSAETAYQQAIALQPESWIYQDELATFYTYAGEYDNAIAQYEIIRKLTPDNYVAYNGIAVIEGLRDNVEQAEKLFLQAIEKRPNAIAYRNLGRTYFLEGRYDESVEQYNRALELELTDREYLTLTFRADAMFWAGDQEGARAEWKRLVDLIKPFLENNPENEDLLVLMVNALVMQGAMEEATPYMDHLATLPMSANYIPYYLGRAYAVMGAYDKALTSLGRALDKGYTRYPVKNDPWFGDLQQAAAYQTFKNEYGL